MIGLAISVASFLSAREAPDYIKKIFPNIYFDQRYEAISEFKRDANYFIETGTSEGWGVAMALSLGFNEINSIEIINSRHSITKKKYADYPQIRFYLGDSTEVLQDILPTINQKILFWLDAHNSDQYCSEQDDMPIKENCPILRELRAIGNHHIKDHIILIDDVRLFSSEEFDNITLLEVISEIKRINPNYQFVLKDGYQESDILVAYVN